MASASRSTLPAVYNLKKTVFLLCDIQERFRPLIHKFEDVVTVAQTMVRAAEILKRPVVVTEQYSKAFGKTVPELSSLLPKETRVFEKKQFSMITEEVWKEALEPRLKADDDTAGAGEPAAVLFGIEAHVCVQQTALQMMEKGYRVFIPVDGVSSQRPGDREVALELLARNGAHLTSTESLLYSLIGTAEHPSFKELAKLVQEHNAKGATSLLKLK